MWGVFSNKKMKKRQKKKKKNLSLLVPFFVQILFRVGKEKKSLVADMLLQCRILTQSHFFSKML